jgi:hypothetical protein
MPSDLIGLWKRTDKDGENEKLLVLPLTAEKYLVSYPSNSQNAMFAKASKSKVDNLTLIQLEWIGTAEGIIPDGNLVFQFLRFKLSDKSRNLSLKLLNPKTVGKNFKSSEELKNSIIKHIDNSKLFRKTIHFRKTDRKK